MVHQDKATKCGIHYLCIVLGILPNAYRIYLYLFFRARPDWAYEFSDRTGPDTQICRTGPARQDRIRIRPNWNEME